MRLTFTLTLDVDVREWAAEYGTGTTPVVVAEDVEPYVLDAVQQCYAGREGLLFNVTLTRDQVPA